MEIPKWLVSAVADLDWRTIMLLLGIGKSDQTLELAVANHGRLISCPVAALHVSGAGVDGAAVAGEADEGALGGQLSHDRGGVRVPIVESGTDAGGECFGGGVRGALQPIGGQRAELLYEDFHPRPVGAGDVQVDAAVAQQPALHQRRLVGGQVIRPDVHVLFAPGGRSLSVYLVEMTNYSEVWLVHIKVMTVTAAMSSAAYRPRWCSSGSRGWPVREFGQYRQRGRRAGPWFSTAVEPCEVDAVRTAELWFSNISATWFPIGDMRHNLLPMRLTQYGQVMVPGEARSEASPNGSIWIVPYRCDRQGWSLRAKPLGEKPSAVAE